MALALTSRRRLLRFALLALVTVSCGPVPLATAKTRVVRWSPFNAVGGLRSGLVATPKFGGDCWTGSFVLHGGYRCAAGHYLYDPCFSDPTRDDAVLCVGDPFTRHVIRLRVSDRMDNDGS